MFTRPRPRAIAALALGASVSGGLIAAALLTGSSPADGQTAVPELAISDAEASSALADLREAAPSAQAAALADGSVSMQEYRAAADTTVACIRNGLATEAQAQGVTVEITVGPITRSTDGYSLDFATRYEFGAALTPDQAARLQPLADGIHGACRTGHLNEVERAFHIGRLNDPAFVSRVDRGMRSCLERAGVRTPAGSDARDAVAAAMQRSESGPNDRVTECLGHYPSVVDLPLQDV